jgi:hypothetical protein
MKASIRSFDLEESAETRKVLENRQSTYGLLKSDEDGWESAHGAPEGWLRTLVIRSRVATGTCSSR